MKKVLFLLAVGLCVVAVALAAPNFGGTWKMNAEQSDMGQRGAGGADRGGSGSGATATRGDRTGSAPSDSGERRSAPAGETATRGDRSGEGRSGAPGGGGMGEMTIKMTESEMIVTQGNSDTTYNLDGKEHTVTSRGGELKYTAKWDEDVLTITGTRGDSPYKLTWEMSADGKTLTRTSTSGETIRKMVYDKQ